MWNTLTRDLSSGITSLSTDMTLHCRLIWPFIVDWCDPSLSVGSASHSVKLILCRLEREHLLELFNFLFCDASLLAYSLPRNSTVRTSVSVVTTYYIRVSDAAVVSVLISAETETSSNCRRCLAMDVRVDSYNQPLRARRDIIIT
jgi:hypothetical protein